MILQNLPSSMSELEIDLNDPGRLLISGAYEEHVMIDKEDYTYIAYLTPGLHNNCNCLVVAIPSNQQPLEFLQQSGLKKLGDEEQIFIVLAIPKNGRWNMDGSDADYLNAVNIQVQSRDYYVTLLGDNIYCYGIGDGANIAHQAAMKSTSQWSGLGTIGNLSAAAMLNAHVSVGGEDVALDEATVQGDKCQLPVWMVMDQIYPHDAKVVRYWKVQNSDFGDVFSGEGADEIYMPLPAIKYSQVNEENISQLRITLNRYEADFEILKTMWKYVGAARRHRNFGLKALRYYRDPKKLGATYRTMVLDGLTREWYEYIPERVRNTGEKVPLVVCLHGRGADGESFFDISGLSSVAEERNFIAVFPTASLFQQKKNGIKNVTLWDEDVYTADRDVAFIRALVEDVKSRNNIDNGRVYACGQSSGGRMATVLAGVASDIFTAVAPWSAMHAIQDPRPIIPEHNIPYFVIYGDKDPGIAGSDAKAMPYPMSDSIMKYRDSLIERFHLKTEPFHYVCGEITYYQYITQANIPMLTFGIVKNMPHANYPRESWISYDEFFSKYYRDENRNLYYMGNLVK